MLKLRHLKIQMPMVIHAHHLALDDLLQLLQVHHKPDTGSISPATVTSSV